MRMVIRNFLYLGTFSLFPPVVSSIDHESFSQGNMEHQESAIVLYTPVNERITPELQQSIKNLQRAFLLTARDFRPSSIEFYTFDQTPCFSLDPSRDHMLTAHGIDTYPTIAFYINGNEVSKIEGLAPTPESIPYFSQRLKLVVYMNYIHSSTAYYYTMDKEGNLVHLPRGITALDNVVSEENF